MNSAQPLTKPITPESGTYSPNGTSWILSYLFTMPRSSSKNAVLRYFVGNVSSASTEPTRSGAATSRDNRRSAATRAGSRRRSVGVAVSGHTMSPGRPSPARRVSSK